MRTHQYALKFPPMPDHMLPPRQRKVAYIGGPFIIFRDGQWHVFRNKWRAGNYGARTESLHYSAPTISLLIERLRKAKDYRYGIPKEKHQVK